MTSSGSTHHMAQILFDLHGTISHTYSHTLHRSLAGEINDTSKENNDFSQPKSLVPGQPISTIRTLYANGKTSGSTSYEEGELPRRILAQIHIFQLQPTERAIEDRFSIRLTKTLESTDSSTIAQRTRLQLGVYDGHRGPWAAQHACESIPGILDDVSAVAALSSGRLAIDSNTLVESIKSRYEVFDKELLEAFTKNNQPTPSISKIRQHADRISTMFGLRPSQKPNENGSRTAVVHTGPLHHGHEEDVREEEVAALRAVSGCTASVILLDWQLRSATASDGKSSTSSVSHDACLINLGDSRAVVAPLHKDPNTNTDIWQTTDVNSSTPSERERLIREHPLDDPRDIVVGKRLFGETLSTRAFGDAHYKLPLYDVDATRDGSDARSLLSREDTALHRHYVRQMSTHLEKAAARQTTSQVDADAQKRKVRTLTLEERYDAMFSSYRSPPYVSATPNVQIWSKRDKVEGSVDDSESDHVTRRMLAILATDGLWDLVESEEAIDIVRELASAGRGSDEKSVNLAQGLVERIVRERGTKPGDDVTILVVEYDTGRTFQSVEDV